MNKKIQKKKNKKGVSLDTLAQLGTRIEKEVDSQEFTYLKSFKENTDVLFKRAKRVCIKNALALGLVDVSNEQRKIRFDLATNTIEVITADNYDKDILRAYWNMWHCNQTLVRKNGKVTGRYCKNRMCFVCNSIRAAVSIKNYQPVFDTWGDDAYFVTLTAPTVKEKELVGRLDEMHEIFHGILEKLKKRYQRKKGEKFEGVRKLECTYNPFVEKFHPHFHFMVRGEKNAKLLYDEWLSRTKHLGTSHKAQDCKKADKGAAMEVFKYFTKIVSSRSADKMVYLRALDVIFKAFKGRRVIQNFGFKLPKEAPKKEIVKSLKEEEIETFEDLQRFLMNQERSDYVFVHELLEKMNKKLCFWEVYEWVEEEQKNGLPFLEIGLILDFLEEIVSEMMEDEETFKWNVEDWVNYDTGEMLTGHKKTNEIDDVVKRFTTMIRDEWIEAAKKAKKKG